MMDKGGIAMAAIAASFIEILVKAVFLGALAYAGIICGKKYRDKKDAAKALEQK